MRKTLQEFTSTSLTTSSNGNTLPSGQLLSETSRTPSEEHALEDSAYQSHSHEMQSHGIKSSSVASFTKFPSEESLSQRRGSSSRPSSALEEKPPSEWYAEYRSQSFQNVGARMEYVRSRSEYDAHIAEIKGTIYQNYI